MAPNALLNRTKTAQNALFVSFPGLILLKTLFLSLLLFFSLSLVLSLFLALACRKCLFWRQPSGNVSFGVSLGLSLVYAWFEASFCSSVSFCSNVSFRSTCSKRLFCSWFNGASARKRHFSPESDILVRNLNFLFRTPVSQLLSSQFSQFFQLERQLGSPFCSFWRTVQKCLFSHPV